MAESDDKNERKRRVIHTRVSEEMEEELKERAASLGVSVSNLVRHVLGNAMDLVDDVVADSASVARSVRGERPRRRAAEADAPVIAWQRAFLNLNALCSKCNDILPKGTEAGIGVTDGSDKPVLCLPCLEELRSDRTD